MVLSAEKLPRYTYRDYLAWEAEVYVLSRGRYSLFKRVKNEKVRFDLSHCEIKLDFGRIFVGG